MKKVFFFMIALFLVLLCSCNEPIYYETYNYAIIKLPNGEIIEGEIEKYATTSDNDQITIIMNGIQYRVHSSNTILIRK